MILSLISISLAQDPNWDPTLPRDAKGIQCSFTEPFISFRYHFESKKLTYYGMDVPLKIYSAQLDQKATKNPFLPEYELKIKEGAHPPPLTLIMNNSGSDGMSDRFYPFSVEYNHLMGGCFFIKNIGTHAVSGVQSDPEPWLNMRTQASIKGKIIGKIYEGTEVNILETTKGWVKISVVSGYGQNFEGWVSSKYLTKIIDQ